MLPSPRGTARCRAAGIPRRGRLLRLAALAAALAIPAAGITAASASLPAAAIAAASHSRASTIAGPAAFGGGEGEGRPPFRRSPGRR